MPNRIEQLTYEKYKTENQPYYQEYWMMENEIFKDIIPEKFKNSKRVDMGITINRKPKTSTEIYTDITVGGIINNNLVFVLFSGEENLLLGSEYFVEHLSDVEKNNISAVINLDTLSGNAEPEITFAGQSYTEAYYLFEEVFKNFFSVNLNPPYSSGDEIHFEKAGIPALSIGQEGQNLHTDKDVLENLDMDDLVYVYNTLFAALESIE